MLQTRNTVDPLDPQHLDVHALSVLAYFGDEPDRVYQLVQWLPVLELLDAHAAASASCCATRTPRPSCASRRRCRSCWPPTFPELREPVRRARRQGRALLQQLDAQLPLAPRAAGCCTSTSTTARATSRAWRATTPSPTTGSSSPARRRSSGTRPGCSSSTLDRLVRIGRPQLDLRPRAGAGAERAAHGPLRADLGGRRGLQQLLLGRHHRAGDRPRACSPCPTYALVYKPHPRVATSADPGDPGGAPRRSSALVARRRRARPARPGTSSLTDGRHPGRDAGLRRDDHRRLVGGAGLALPAHRAAAASSPTGTTTPSGCAWTLPVSRCADVIDSQQRGRA